MKIRLPILLLSMLLLTAVGYVHVFQKTMGLTQTSLCIGDSHDDAEEGSEKSTEENDQDEDPFKLHEIIFFSLPSLEVSFKTSSHTFSFSGYFPEIVSPPPQI